MLTAIVAKSPLVFVKLAENTVGEYDLVRFFFSFVTIPDRPVR